MVYFHIFSYKIIFFMYYYGRKSCARGVKHQCFKVLDWLHWLASHNGQAWSKSQAIRPKFQVKQVFINEMGVTQLTNELVSDMYTVCRVGGVVNERVYDL